MTGVAFTADGAKLVTGSQDKTFRVLNLADQMQLASIETPAPVNAVAIVAEGKQVATGGGRQYHPPVGTARRPAGRAPKPVKEMTGHGGPVTSLAAIGPTGAQLLSGSKDNTVRTWDVVAGNAVKNMNHTTPVEASPCAPTASGSPRSARPTTCKLWNAEDQQACRRDEGRPARRRSKSAT